MRDLLPLFVDIAARRVVLVGGGLVALGKLRQLQAVGADVLVVAPDVHDEITASGVAVAKRAFDASDVSRELWNSQMNAARDSLGNFPKFTPPTVYNGHVYQATFSKQLCVYGLLN